MAGAHPATVAACPAARARAGDPIVLSRGPHRLPRTRGDLHRGGAAEDGRRRRWCPAVDRGRTAARPESTPAALEAVRTGAADYACVPIENSIEGSVLPTLDSLAGGSPLQIYAELHPRRRVQHRHPAGCRGRAGAHRRCVPGGAPPRCGNWLAAQPARRPRSCRPTPTRPPPATSPRAAPTPVSAPRWRRSATAWPRWPTVSSTNPTPAPGSCWWAARPAAGPHRCRPHLGGAAHRQRARARWCRR